MTIRAHLDEQFAREFGGLPQIAPPVRPSIEVNEYLMDGIVLGNADIEINSHEAIWGICAQGESDEQ